MATLNLPTQQQYNQYSSYLNSGDMTNAYKLANQFGFSNTDVNNNKQTGVPQYKDVLTSLLSAQQYKPSNVGQLYQDVLGRDADPSGQQFYNQFYSSGYTPEKVADFIIGAQPEIQQKQAAAQQQAIAKQQQDAQAAQAAQLKLQQEEYARQQAAQAKSATPTPAPSLLSPATTAPTPAPANNSGFGPVLTPKPTPTNAPAPAPAPAPTQQPAATTTATLPSSSQQSAFDALMNDGKKSGDYTAALNFATSLGYTPEQIATGIAGNPAYGLTKDQALAGIKNIQSKQAPAYRSTPATQDELRDFNNLVSNKDYIGAAQFGLTKGFSPEQIAQYTASSVGVPYQNALDFVNQQQAQLKSSNTTLQNQNTALQTQLSTVQKQLDDAKNALSASQNKKYTTTPPTADQQKQFDNYIANKDYKNAADYALGLGYSPQDIASYVANTMGINQADALNYTTKAQSELTSKVSDLTSQNTSLQSKLDLLQQQNSNLLKDTVYNQQKQFDSQGRVNIGTPAQPNYVDPLKASGLDNPTSLFMTPEQYAAIRPASSTPNTSNYLANKGTQQYQDIANFAKANGISVAQAQAYLAQQAPNISAQQVSQPNAIASNNVAGSQINAQQVSSSNIAGSNVNAQANNPSAFNATSALNQAALTGPAAQAQAALINQNTPGLTANATLNTVDPRSTSQYQLAQITGKDSPLMQLASESGKRLAANRGLLNSSMSSGAAQAEMVKAAQPFALQDAQTYGASQIANQQAANQVALANQQAIAQMLQSNQNAQQNVNLSNQKALNDIAQFNATSQNNSSLANQQAQNQVALANQATQSELAKANQSTNLQGQLANQQNAFETAKANQSSQLQSLLANQSSNLTAQQANQKTQQDIALANQQAALDAAKSNQSSTLQANLANQQANLTAQQSNQKTQQEINLANAKAQNDVNQLNTTNAVNSQMLGYQTGLDAAKQAYLANQDYVNKANLAGSINQMDIDKQYATNAMQSLLDVNKSALQGRNDLNQAILGIAGNNIKSANDTYTNAVNTTNTAALNKAQLFNSEELARLQNQLDMNRDSALNGFEVGKLATQQAFDQWKTQFNAKAQSDIQAMSNAAVVTRADIEASRSKYKTDADKQTALDRVNADFKGNIINYQSSLINNLSGSVSTMLTNSKEFKTSDDLWSAIGIVAGPVVAQVNNLSKLAGTDYTYTAASILGITDPKTIAILEKNINTINIPK